MDGKFLALAGIRKFQPTGADLLDLDGTVAVHDLSCRLSLVARTGGKDHAPSAPDSVNVVFRVGFDDPERGQIPSQRHFYVEYS